MDPITHFVLSIDVKHRLLTVFCVIIVGGLVNDVVPSVSRAFITPVGSKSILNEQFVKLGWMWTYLAVIPLMLLTSVTRNFYKTFTNSDGPHDYVAMWKSVTRVLLHNDRTAQGKFIIQHALITKDILRIVVNTLAWKVSVSFFEFVESKTWYCSTDPLKSLYEDFETPKSCRLAGHTVISGYDISGHTFLLVFCNLLIISELRVVFGWKDFGKKLVRMGDVELKPKHQEYLAYLESSGEHRLAKELKDYHSMYYNAPLAIYKKLDLPIRSTFYSSILLTLIWDYMLLHTALFYHTMIQKLIAALWASSIWFVLYRVLYKRFKMRPMPTSDLNHSFKGDGVQQSRKNKRAQDKRQKQSK